MIAQKLQIQASGPKPGDARVPLATRGRDASAPGERTATGAPRVIVSGTVLGLGGIRTHLVLLCQLLRRHGVEVTVFATDSHWDSSLVNGLRNLGVRFVLPPALLRPARKLAAAYCGLFWPLRTPTQADSLYCIGTGRSHFFLNRRRPKGTISINHEIVSPPEGESLSAESAHQLDTSIANSHKVAEMMRTRWPQKPIRVIPFLTSDRAMPAPVRPPRPANQPLRVVYLGRLVEQKRPDQLVRRWSEITRHPALAGARLNVFGYDPDGKMIEGLKKFVGESGLSNRVNICGEYALTDLPGIFLENDLVVLPSLWEGLPLVLVEAMSHGVPFVATAAGGTEELGWDNPDVCVTGTAWVEFETGLIKMAERLQRGEIDAQRLHAWAEARYGSAVVSAQWLQCLLQPRQFFALHD
jgi:glycosyltransferase involved in cell wall biosynthesis